jgi:hypothetical protein
LSDFIKKIQPVVVRMNDVCGGLSHCVRYATSASKLAREHAAGKAA